ncbi:MAG: hypothetical protein KIT81_00600 [Alphaproteobacteria bacterium]|nr:hypothetical protein [Alphaproteobacteria bacterium]
MTGFDIQVSEPLLVRISGEEGMHTRHSTERCQQRGIQPDVVDIILDYGARKFRHGAEVLFMDHRARRAAKAALGARRFARISDRLNTYLVVSNDGDIITAAPRKRRLKFG